MIHRRCALPVLILLAGCTSAAPPRAGEPASATANADVEPKSPLQRAEALIGSSDYAGARRALEEHLAGSPEDTQSRYLLAKTLSFLGELRGARAEVERVVTEKPADPLAWDLLGSLHEQLGDHHKALRAYFEVQKRTESLAPVLAIARCQLYLGQPEAALITLEAARSRKAEDAWTEFFTYQALRRMGRGSDAETAARAYLGIAKDEPSHTVHVEKIRAWLDAQRSSLRPTTQQALVDFVRAACRLRLPDANPPEESVLARAPERLFVYDNRPVFVTLFPRKSSARFRGMGRGRNLASAIKGAVQALQRSEGYAPIKVREAALRIDVGRGLEPIALVRDAQCLVATPAIERGRHGIALRADGHEVFCLPGDPVSEDLPGLEDLLAYACRAGGLAPAAWKSSTGAIFRFETESFLSLSPGSTAIPLANSEPGPLPEPTPAALAKAEARGSRWLTTLLQPGAGLASGYSPTTNTFDASGDTPVSLADPFTRARTALAFALLNQEDEDAVLVAARDHLIADWMPADAAAQAATLAALCAGPEDARGAARARLAEALLGSARPARAEAALALTLLGRRTGERRWSEAALRLSPSPLPKGGIADVELLTLRGAEDSSAAAEVLAWADRQLAVAPAEGPGRARWLAALARAATLANARNHPNAARLRAAVVDQARSLMALQLGPRHRFFCKEPSQALGGFRRDLGNSHLDPQMTAECVMAMAAIRELLAR